MLKKGTCSAFAFAVHRRHCIFPMCVFFSINAIAVCSIINGSCAVWAPERPRPALLRPFFRDKSRGPWCPRAAKCGSVDKNKDRKPRNIRELKAVKKIIKKRQKKVVAEQKKVRMFAPAKTGYVPCLRSSYIRCGIGIWESEKTFSKKISKLLCGKKKGFIFAPA